MSSSDLVKKSYLFTGDKSACNGCRACEQACVVGCLTMLLQEDGFFYPKVDRSRCVQCGRCEAVCSYNREDHYQNIKSTKAFGLTNKNEEILLKSSSGGVFFELAHKTIKEGGVVFGAILDEKFLCRHISIFHSHDLFKLLTSKYIQSDTSKCYEQVSENIKIGKKVLFSGTPCQIAGLKGFLGRDYENLLCVDLACHGVPSQEEFLLFVEEMEKKYDGKISNISFRDKSAGGWKHSFSFCLKKGGNQKRHILAPYRVPYYCFFLLGMNLRESCYYCPFACLNRTGDITLADFWQVEQALPRAYHSKGVSAVLCNSDKGYIELMSVRDSFTINPTDIAKVAKYNQPFQKPCEKPSIKDRLVKSIFISKGYYQAYKQYIPYSYRFKEFCKNHIPDRLKSLLRKVR